MACFKEEDKQHFPVKNIEDLVVFFESHLKTKDEPNLALLSIILGCIENSLTCNRKHIQGEIEKYGKTEKSNLPLLQLSKVEALYQRFVSFVKGSIDSTSEIGRYTSRESVKKISDVIWSGLTSNYTDKAHLQSLYSYLTGNKLDCFGVALAVVAACQILGYNDVHLSLSEDHAWVVFGEDGKETAEVTWHGKGVEDRRGQPISIGGAEQKWLYLDGQAVVCNRHMELAAIVASINPAINANADSVEMARLQQELLWILYDLGHLKRYPMALGTLGDLEELDPTPERPCPKEIFEKGVAIAGSHYNNHHVYPHTYMGGYSYRKGQYKEALRHWAEAAEVISHYNYSRDDEEIYKEFLEIAHDLIPHIVKLASDGYLIGSTHHKSAQSHDISPHRDQADFLKDRENYEFILRFYDGICEWEEGSSTPVLHITWAKHFVFSISKFDGAMREGIEVVREPGDESSESSSSESDSDSEVDREDEKENRKHPNRKLLKNGGAKIVINETIDESQKTNVIIPETVSKPTLNGDNNNEIVKQGNDIIKTNEGSALKMETEEELNTDTSDSNIADLARACADSILNPDFLLGKGEPFTTSIPTSMFTTITDAKASDHDLKPPERSNGSKHLVTTDIESDFLQKITSSPTLSILSSSESQANKNGGGGMNNHKTDPPVGYPAKLQFRSAKMKGMKGLLTSTRLNTSAINLQMTAQSQVSLKHSKVHSTYDQAVPRKRTRRSEQM